MVESILSTKEDDEQEDHSREHEESRGELHGSDSIKDPKGPKVENESHTHVFAQRKVGSVTDLVLHPYR